jgi:thiamine monophosphate kinase
MYQNLLVATLCGWALARAHARSGDAAVLTGYLGTSAAFEEAIADFGEAYADQNERDHAALVAAVRAGRVEARHVE